MTPPPPDKGPTVAQQLVHLARDHYTITRADTGEPIAYNGDTVALPLRGGTNSFRAQLAHRYNAQTGRVPGQGALADALQVLEGQAQTEPPIPLATRIATQANGHLLYDLGRPDNHHITIQPGHWHLNTTHDGPAIFRRTRLTGPQPDPIEAPIEALDLLRNHTNISDDDWPLTICWLVAALLPHTPCPGLYLHGEQGTAKTTTGRHLRQTVDPSPVPLGAPPDDIRDWATAANSARVIGIDNLSSIPAWFSDALCRIVTGEGYARRALYTDGDLHVIEMRRAVIITAIDAGSLRGDLAERLLAIELDPIDPHHRLTDHDSDQAYQRDLPRILGALFTLTAQVLEQMPDTQLEMLPRMADFGRLVATIDRIRHTQASDRYAGGLAQLNRAVVDSDPFASGIRTFLEHRDQWTGTATDLLAIIDGDHTGPKPKWWPADGAACSRRLKRVAPALRAEGVGIDWTKGTKGTRLVHLSHIEIPQGPGGAMGGAIEGGRRESRHPENRATQSRHPGTPTDDSEPPKSGASGAIRGVSLCPSPEERKREREHPETAPLAPPDHDDEPPTEPPNLEHILAHAPTYHGPHPAQLADLGYPLHPDQEHDDGGAP